VGAGDGEVTPALGIAPRQAAGPSTPVGADPDAQLAQARELEAKLAEEYRTVRLLRTPMAGETSAHGKRVRELGRQARDRINADNPDVPPRASQKLVAAAMLLRAMPAPSTPEARNLQREVQALIEQAGFQQAESSASRIRQQGNARGDGAAQGGEPSVHAGEARSVPPTQGAQRPRSGSLTRAERWTVTLATSSMLAARAARTPEQRWATTLDGQSERSCGSSSRPGSSRRCSTQRG
jgi:murein DD-endopeptidase MepM/ murein hydrolase activator NlpD